MYQALTVIHVLIALAIIGLVMLQQGRGADAGAGFGGASGTLFGARGAASFLSRTTAVLATLFFVTSLSLAYLAGKQDNKGVDIMEESITGTEAAKPDMPPISNDAAVPGKADMPPVGEPPKPAEPAK